MQPSALRIAVLRHADDGVAKLIGSDPGREAAVVDERRDRLTEAMRRNASNAEVVADLPSLLAEVIRVAQCAGTGALRARSRRCVPAGWSFTGFANLTTTGRFEVRRMAESISQQAIVDNHHYWQECQDTHLANGDYYRRVHAVLPLLCELHLDKSSHVLDVGCGNGEFSAVIARHCGSLEAFDLSPALIAQAEALNVPNAKFTVKGVDELRLYSDNTFDVIFVMGVFAALHSGLFEDTVIQIGRLLKSGGIVITRDSVMHDEELICQVKDDYHAHYRNFDRYLEVFNQQGLKLTRSVFLESFRESNIYNCFFVFDKEVQLAFDGEIDRH